MSGKLEKLIIEPFTDADCENPKEGVESYTALINPDQIVMDTKVEYETPESGGGSGDQQIFAGIKSPKFNLKLLFDSTGTLLTNGTASAGASPKREKPKAVHDQIEAFRKVTNYFHGEEHEPSYVRITWGGVIFKGRLETLKITYTLFSPAGLPIRATGDAGFIGSLDPHTKSKKDNKQSPDLTHVRVVKKGETLPLMCDRIYRDSSRYLEVARVNKLSNYRKLQPGQKLFFPPIKLENK